LYRPTFRENSLIRQESSGYSLKVLIAGRREPAIQRQTTMISCANQPSEEVSDIFRRLHRSTHLHFVRSTTKESFINILRRIRKDRRQKVDMLFQSKSDNDTILQVAERLNDLVAKRQQRRKIRNSARTIDSKKHNGCETVVSLSSSSFDDSEYLGDTSAVSSVIATTIDGVLEN
jgi:hypothetical protein